MSSFFDMLSTFVAVAEKGSFSAAARSLGKAQSGVSTTISNLEIDLGVDLFDRTHRTPQLTPAGKALLREAEAALMHATRLKEHAYRLSASEEEETINLALDESLPYASVSPIFEEFAEAFPDVSINIEHASSIKTMTRLSDQSLNIAILLSQDQYRQPLRFQRIGRMLISEVIHHSHPLASLPIVTTGDLVQHRQLIYSRSLNSLLKQEHLVSTRQWFCDNYGAMIAMINQGLGWAAIPNSLVKDRLESGELKRIKHEMYPYTQWEVSIDMVWNSLSSVGKGGLWLQKRFAKEPIYCA
ncbi:LysR family transcriptional regulator [Endozoicomonas elysicola]|uniref:HTH lysR-type domain-containing protein n=1 Tax=Endozoicomonas elysicola TaxID=305900 RepID=A0A081K999_9GAMM|nr:LysR family transcriptional regulator [Endozoicomonas elysicola]KEI70725.1 hypothetical protein GV64_08205 [Endozoicomonas elysicola]